MNDHGAIDHAAGQAFRALQARARADYGGNTGSLLTVYAVESFLRRLALSPYAHLMVLKGGMLLAANNIRRMTKDADLSTRGLENDEQNVQEVVREIASLRPDPHDGIVIDVSSVRTELMREDAEYHGIRCKLVAHLGKAKVPFALDFSFGDPAASTVILLDSVIDQPALKLVTAMQRRETSTRDRDFADLWVTSRRHSLSADELRAQIHRVAEHREQRLMAMAEALAAMPDRQQPYAAMVQRMAYLSPPPERFVDLLAGVVDFVDPVLESGAGQLSHWDHEALRWV